LNVSSTSAWTALRSCGVYVANIEVIGQSKATFATCRPPVSMALSRVT
jgi:hypothetical protein